MWTKRDWIMLASAATATFALTLAAFYPRVANAVDERPVTTAINVPTLKLEHADVSAQLDKDKPNLVLITVRNTTNQAATAEFTAQAENYGSVFSGGRTIPPPTTKWSQDYSINLEPGQTKVLQVTPSEEAFQATVASQFSQSKSGLPNMTAGRSVLILTNTDAKHPVAISALTLASGAPAKPASIQGKPAL